MTAPARATRRSPATIRQLLLDAARTLFARQSYLQTTTREIAESAGVAEHLLFRHFGSKAALFREALIVPFTQLVGGFASQWASVVPAAAAADDLSTSEERVAREFIGALYDLFVEHRGLLVTLWTTNGLTEDELAETGIGELNDALGVLAQLGADGMRILGMQSNHQDLAARSSVAMVAGMAAFGAPFFGRRVPSREVIVEELMQMTLHGFLHRGA